jgi:hypothetical protein
MPKLTQAHIHSVTNAIKFLERGLDQLSTPKYINGVQADLSHLREVLEILRLVRDNPALPLIWDPPDPQPHNPCLGLVDTRCFYCNREGAETRSTVVYDRPGGHPTPPHAVPVHYRCLMNSTG